MRLLADILLYEHRRHRAETFRRALALAAEVLFHGVPHRFRLGGCLALRDELKPRAIAGRIADVFHAFDPRLAWTFLAARLRWPAPRSNRRFADGGNMALQPGGNAADTFDYVIVGSGAAGSVLSARLMRRPRGYRVRAGMRPARPAPVHPHPRRLHQDVVQSGLHLAIQDGTVRGFRRPADPDDAGPHSGRIEFDQRHDLQSRPARGFRQLGAARQSRLGLCRCAAVFQAHRTPHRHRRRPHPWARAAICRSPISTGSIRCARRSSPARSARGFLVATTTTVAIARRVSVISSARSIAAIAIRPRACSCIRRVRRSGWMCAPMRAPRRFCSMARARSACVMSMTAIARRNARCRRGAR